MTSKTTTDAPERRTLRHWLLALSGPIAWSIAFAIWIALTLEVCSSGVGPWLLLVAVGALAASAVSALVASRALRHHAADDTGDRIVERFLSALAVGTGLLFMLVVALSAVPVFLVQACP